MNGIIFSGLQFLIVSILCVTNAQISPLKFMNISTEAGLSSVGVNAVIQDKKGFMWFGTENGLNRYDGYTVTEYRNIPGDTTSLSNDFIWSINEDRDGYIWIATESGGLNSFDPLTGKFVHYKHNPEDTASISSNVLQYVFTDRDNNIWAGTWGKGLNLFNRSKGSFVRFQHNKNDPKTISNDKVFCIYQDRNNNIWIGTDGGGLDKYNPEAGTFTNYIFDKTPQSTSNAISKIFEDSEGTLWLGTFGSGLIKFNPFTAETVHFVNSGEKGAISGSFIWDIIEDVQGYLWIATQSNGINIKDKTLEYFHYLKPDVSNPHSFGTTQTKSLYSDRTGVLWIGTSVEGVYKTDRKKEKFFQLTNESSNPNSLPENYVFTLCEDSENHIWIGMYNSLCRYDPLTGKFTEYPLKNAGPKSVDGSIVRYIYEDSHKDIWVGTYFGRLNKYNRKTDSFTKIDLDFNGDNPDANNIRAIYEDSSNDLWFCSNGGGLIHYNRGKNEYKVFRADTVSLLSSDYVISAGEDKYGNLWTGTYGMGLNRFNKHHQKFVTYYPDNKTSAPFLTDNVSEIYLDSGGNLWFGTTRGGICLYDYGTGTLLNYSEKEGLASNSIYGILEDNNNNFWISTSKGISRINPANRNIKNFDHNQGLTKGEFNPSARLKTRKGWMYFGGTKGISYFHPDSLYDNQLIPPVTITSLKVLDKNFNLPWNISFTDTVVLEYYQNSLSFEFASLDYTNPSQNRYAYMIEGIDENWVYINQRRFVNIPQLNPGKYKFRVKATNNDGYWNEEGTQITLIVKPPYWSTWWAYLIYISFVILSLVMLRSYELKSRKRKEKKRLEKEKAEHEEFSRRLLRSQEEERKRIASELHDSLGQNLLIIKNRAMLAARSDNVAFEKKQLLDISEGASASIDEVRRISYNLHPYHLDSLGLTKSIKAIIDNLESTTETNFSFELDNIDGIFNKEKEINFFRIIQECINNIIKHSQAKQAGIVIKRREKFLTVNISDNGSGFSQNGPEQSKNREKGFGLKNLQNRAALLEGEIVIKSSPEMGTHIKLLIHLT
jgi:signal transduction histidine kinase/ligand-binding sensor domain-containing protein